MQEVLIAFRGSRGWDSLQQSPQEMEGYLEREEKKKKKGSGNCAYLSPCLFFSE